MNIYEESGYLDVAGILALKQPFNFIVGGRGDGKTFGALKYVLEHPEIGKFMLMRRTQAQADLINKPELSPFKPVCEYLNVEIDTKPLSKYSAEFLRGDEIIGFTCALSTIANMRGFDASDVTLLVFDEFCGEKHERPIKFEGDAFKNCYETLNRNREFDGRPPLQVLCLANAFNIANPIFMDMGLVGIAERMRQRNQEVYINKERGIVLILPRSEKIAEKKRDTALYRATSSAFTDMALNNEFVYNPTDNILSQPIHEYRPVCRVGDITIYKHKSIKKYYVSEFTTGDPESFKTDEVEMKRFIKAYGRRLFQAYMNDNVIFENMYCKSLFEYYLV